MLVRTFLVLMSLVVWQPFMPIHLSFIVPTISYVVSYNFDLTITLNIASFKIGCFKSFYIVNFWYVGPFMLVSLCSIGLIWFVSLKVDLSMSHVWRMFAFGDVCKHLVIYSLLTTLHLHYLSLAIVFGLPLLLTSFWYPL